MNVMTDARLMESYRADDKGLLTFRLKRDWAELQPKRVFYGVLPTPQFAQWLFAENAITLRLSIELPGSRLQAKTVYSPSAAVYSR